MAKVKETLGFDEFSTAKKTAQVWKSLLAEFLGNLLLNFFGCLSCVTLNESNTLGRLVMIALTFGFVIFVVVQTLGHVSGAHVNPAVTSGMLVTGNISVIKGLLYIVAQCLGALTGSAILKALTPEKLHDTGLGMTQVDPQLTSLQGFGIEFFLGFVLVLTVFGVCDPNKPDAKAAAALAIGLAVALGHLAAIEYTGSSMNPARTFGSAVIAGIWENHWVYWIGPCVGGAAAGLLYKHAFAAPPLGPVKIIERYTAVSSDERELKRLDGTKNEA